VSGSLFPRVLLMRTSTTKGPPVSALKPIVRDQLSKQAQFNIGSSRSQIGVADVLEADGQALGHAVKDEDVIDTAVRGANDIAAIGVETSTQGVTDKVFAGDLGVEAIHDEVVVHVAALTLVASGQRVAVRLGSVRHGGAIVAGRTAANLELFRTGQSLREN